MSQVDLETSELSGPALDWAVAHALGAEVKGHQFCKEPGSYVHPNCTVFPNGDAYTNWRPSTEWSHGGPLIDKYCVEVSSRSDFPFSFGPWGAAVTSTPDVFWTAETPLIAVCRAIVASKLGNTVQMPADLLEVPHV